MELIKILPKDIPAVAKVQEPLKIGTKIMSDHYFNGEYTYSQFWIIHKVVSEVCACENSFMKRHYNAEYYPHFHYQVLAADCDDEDILKGRTTYEHHKNDEMIGYLDLSLFEDEKYRPSRVDNHTFPSAWIYTVLGIPAGTQLNLFY